MRTFSNLHLIPIMEEQGGLRGDWSFDLGMDDRVNEWHENSIDKEFLRDILHQPEESAASGASPVLAATTATAVGSLFFEQTSLGGPAVNLQVFQSQLDSHGTDSLPLSSSRTSQGTKKNRSTSYTLDHLMSERKRRQELREKFIALSATIPDLKKMDKVYVLNEAINYVKQLQKRVKELEEEIKKSSGESEIAIARSHIYIDEGNILCEMNSKGCYRPNETLPYDEARVLGKEILIKVHCGKQKGILLKILSQLESLHLSIASCNVLPFGNTLDITIIAQMSDKYSTIVNDLVKSLRLDMLKSCDEQQ